MFQAKNRVLPHAEFSVDTQSKWSGDFFFIQAADTQLGLTHVWGNKDTDIPDGVPYPDSNWDAEIMLCKLSVEVMNNMNPKPAFFVVCGDLVDAFSDKYPDIRKKQEEDFKKIYSNLSPEIPMICVCGNHDIGNSPTRESIDLYKSSFGDDYFTFYKNGCCFIVLNSQFYEDSSNVPDLYQNHEHWLELELKLAAELGAKHIVIFQHIPWFVKSFDEKKFYFNIEKDLRLQKLERFYKAGVRKIFCGHYHRNAGGFYKDLEVVVTSAIGCQIGPDDHGMRIVKVKENSIEHEYHPLSHFPIRITY